MVQLSLICLFLKKDFDYVSAAHTVPYHSSRNPIEKIITIVIYVGLQSVGLACKEMNE